MPPTLMHCVQGIQLFSVAFCWNCFILIGSDGVVSGTVFALCFLPCVWELTLEGGEGSSGTHLQGAVARGREKEIKRGKMEGGGAGLPLPPHWMALTIP